MESVTSKHSEHPEFSVTTSQTRFVHAYIYRLVTTELQLESLIM